MKKNIFTVLATAGAMMITFNASAQWVRTAPTTSLQFPADNVGIGTAAPGDKLEVSGNIRVSAGNEYKIGGNRALKLDGNKLYIGSAAGASVTTGDFNLFAGTASGQATTSGSYNLFVGINSGRWNTTGAGNTFLGLNAGIQNTSGNSNIFVGGASGNTNTTGSQNTAVGANSGYLNSTGESNVFMGFNSGYNNTFSYNTFVGHTAGYSNTSGGYNAFVGHSSGYSNSFGSANAFFGQQSGYDNTTGSSNTFLGNQAGAFNKVGNENAFVGTGAGNGSDASRNTFMGFHAAYDLTSYGNHNVAIGYKAGINGLIGGLGDYNVLLGAETGINAGTGTSNGTYNTFLGYRASAEDNLTNASAIGHRAHVCENNTMVFGNREVYKWGFSVCPQDGHALEVGFDGSNGNGAYLTDGGDWTNTSDRNKKENIKEVDYSGILKKVNELPISIWSYKGESKSAYHIGPMAQDFNKLFGTGRDDKSISTIDPAGVALAAIKALSQEELILKNRITELENKLKDLELKFNNANGITPSDKSDSYKLFQNVPNPANGKTIINYVSPEAGAYIIIYNLNGAEIKRYNVNAGQGSVEINKGELGNGMYIYSLIIHNTEVQTLKMIISE